MGSDVEPDETASSESARPVRRPRRLLPFVVLAIGGLAAAYLAASSPREQHLKLVLGPGAAHVTAVEVQYVAGDGDIAREVRMAFPSGSAPRVLSLEPQLTDGDYRLRIELDTREGRRTVERRVTLGGGTTQVDLAGVVTAPPASSSPAPALAP